MARCTIGRKQVVFGVRGDQNVDVTVFGSEAAIAQRALRKLGAESGDALGASASFDEGRSGRVTIARLGTKVLSRLGSRETRDREAPAYDDELGRSRFARAEGAERVCWN